MAGEFDAGFKFLGRVITVGFVAAIVIAWAIGHYF